MAADSGAGTCFGTQMTETEKRRAVSLLGSFHDLCARHGVEYSLCVGSALGLRRHRGFIPWDDDIDVCVPERDQPRLWSALAHLDTQSAMDAQRMGGAELFAGVAEFHKVFGRRGDPIEAGDGSSHRWTWPFIDVFVIPEQSPHFADLFPSAETDVPFEGRARLRGPRDTSAHLDREYGRDHMREARDSGYSHRLERQSRSCPESRAIRRGS